jgi:hypothetical protein
MKSATPEFIEMTATLSQEAKLRILSRTRGKVYDKYGKNKLSDDEAIAIQLTLEDEHQKEWIDKVRELRAKEEKKAQKRNEG